MIPLTKMLEYGTIKTDVEIIKVDPLKLHDFASLCLRFVLPSIFYLLFQYCCVVCQLTPGGALVCGCTGIEIHKSFYATE
jgi:hypothetical protein